MQERKNRDESAASAFFISGLLGAGAGAIIGASVDQTILGGVIIGLYLGITETITHIWREPGATKPHWHRVIGSTIYVAALAVILDAIWHQPLFVALPIGVMMGVFGLGLRKFLVGVGLGIAAGVLAMIFTPDINAAILGGGITLLYRLILAVIFRNTDPITIAGENIPPEQARFVVPFDAHTGYVGIEYVETLARETQGSYAHSPREMGIVATLDDLNSLYFDPSQVHPLIREFYEHTSRFKLAIIPEWNPYMRIPFWFFKTYVAQRIGQANLPFNQEEAQSGIISFIDTIDYEKPDSTPVNISTLRIWVRAFEATMEALYVGIYTVVRNEDIGYVSVGFPLPGANFTATLLPFNQENGNFLLKTADTGFTFPGHYLSFIDPEDKSLVILKLALMDETIDVFINAQGELKTDHSFYFGGFRFLTLHYHIERKSA